MSEDLKFGDENILLSLKKAMNDNKEVERIYSSIIDKILTSEFWSTNNKEALRVKWYDGRTAREVRNDIFACSGIYLWGAGEVPRYIGKAERQSFRRRFNRYIFGRNSQCDLAKIYEKEIKEKGIEGFPPDIREWYRRRFGGTVRLRHAVDFAKYGIDNIWFTLFPANEEVAGDIGTIEEILIGVANNWNINKKLEPLINEQHR